MSPSCWIDSYKWAGLITHVQVLCMFQVVRRTFIDNDHSVWMSGNVRPAMQRLTKVIWWLTLVSYRERKQRINNGECSCMKALVNCVKPLSFHITTLPVIELPSFFSRQYSHAIYPDRCQHCLAPFVVLGCDEQPILLLKHSESSNFWKGLYTYFYFCNVNLQNEIEIMLNTKAIGIVVLTA